MKITSPQSAVQFFHPRFAGVDVEEFWVAALNSVKDVTACSRLFRGSADHCLFHPRDVLRFARVNNASSFIVAHNHPSGDPRPSDEDIRITTRLTALAAIVQIPLVDHVILAPGGRYYSFLEGGALLKAKNPAWPSCR
ncbi:MAG: JAB domain-containing protein [Calothrix sp. SM1_5_4]|nr:JAB domain-containing protein [Calothrix sp. SM1_5_4]